MRPSQTRWRARRLAPGERGARRQARRTRRGARRPKPPSAAAGDGARHGQACELGPRPLGRARHLRVPTWARGTGQPWQPEQGAARRGQWPRGGAPVPPAPETEPRAAPAVAKTRLAASGRRGPSPTAAPAPGCRPEAPMRRRKWTLAPPHRQQAGKKATGRLFSKEHGLELPQQAWKQPAETRFDARTLQQAHPSAHPKGAETSRPRPTGPQPSSEHGCLAA
mmetsp:Transcript_11727/g.45721  ORF Transcript_11727/g.45721 Transcript_11727/m.45721 type:complete len:223 (-) Transcript_11727:334-1002(-)